MAARERESGSADKAMKEQLLRAKQNCRQQQQNLDRALASLLSRIYEVHELKAQVRQLQGQVELLKGLVPEHLLAKVRALR
jgi:prefoldin subunit 5